jgi:hypothetical protein
MRGRGSSSRHCNGQQQLPGQQQDTLRLDSCLIMSHSNWTQLAISQGRATCKQGSPYATPIQQQLHAGSCAAARVCQVFLPQLEQEPLRPATYPTLLCTVHKAC